VGKGQPLTWEQIKASLVARGIWDENGVSRKARARFCRRCRSPVIAGYDHDRCAFAAYVDPMPLNPLGEAMALMADRPTYSLRWVGGHYELDYRSSESIAAHPAGTQPHIEVVAAHVCDAEMASHYRGPSMAHHRPIERHDNDDPPF
jgi:hypothetical protein